jgi:hypothetical protein
MQFEAIQSEDKNMMNKMMKCFLFCALLLVASSVIAGPIAKIAIREALEKASQKSGRAITGSSVRETTELALAQSAEKYGDKALAAAADGGLELIEATTKYGDDVMRLAVDASPDARRVLALKTEALLPLARRVGPDALELEAKSPGLAGKIFATFGDDAGKIIARNVPPEDIPRLLKYAEKADSQPTRDLLLQTYQKEGKTLFERIPARFVLAGGLTAAMLYGTHNITKPIGDTLGKNPDLVSQVLNRAVIVSGVVIVIIVILLLWRFNLMPWHRKQKKKN